MASFVENPRHVLSTADYMVKVVTNREIGLVGIAFIYSRFRLIGPPVNRVSRLIGQIVKNKIQLKIMHYVKSA